MTDTAPTLAQLADDLGSGRTTSRALVEECLAQIEASSEGRATFVKVSGEAARQAADAMDLLRRAGAAPSSFAGIPVSIKDLFDIEGEVTTAGSRALADAAPASADAPAVARLRRAGFVVIGRTNMTEFAYSGIGLNPHYGTPRSVWDRDGGRVPGGSSSGAAISVAEGMAHAALGTDTGGSCRIPAAFNGIVGYKPTARRVPTAGAVPLSGTLDSVGPLGASVECCAAMDAVLAGEPLWDVKPRSVKGLRLGVPTTVVFDSIDSVVAETFERAIARLSDAGALVERIEVPEFAEVAVMSVQGGFSAAEAYAWHRELIARRGQDYDPRVVSRIRRGEPQSAAHYLEISAHRKSMVERLNRRYMAYDAFVMPTVAITPPPIADLVADDDTFTKANLLALRNCTLINFADGCAISLPVHREGEAPVGLMLAGPSGADRSIFELAAGIAPVARG